LPQNPVAEISKNNNKTELIIFSFWGLEFGGNCLGPPEIVTRKFGWALPSEA
jgi:hypothetical protein